MAPPFKLTFYICTDSTENMFEGARLGVCTLVDMTCDLAARNGGARMRGASFSTHHRLPNKISASYPQSITHS